MPHAQCYLGGDRAGCCYRWCEHWIFSSTCLIVFVALFLPLILYCCSDLAQDEFLIASFVGIVFFKKCRMHTVIWVGTGRVVVIDGVNIGSFLQHVGSYQSQGCRYRCCKYWIFSSTCLIFFVALFLLLILYCCSDLAQGEFFNR